MAGLRRAMTRLRGYLAAVLGAWIGLLAGDARAQSCHAPVLVAPRELGLRGAVETAVASFDTRRYRGEYQGVSGVLSYARGPWLLYGRLPWYRITRNGATDRGLGDASAAVRVRVLSDEPGELRAGLALAATLPTGEVRSDLGMGHAMVTPGVFVAYQRGPVWAEALLSYGRALSHGGAHRHGARGTSPLVNPMNGSEVQSALAVVTRVHPALSLVAGIFAAVPIAEADGTPRSFVNGGVRAHRSFLDATLDLAYPLAGDPFLLRLMLSVGASF